VTCEARFVGESILFSTDESASEEGEVELAKASLRNKELWKVLDRFDGFCAIPFPCLITLSSRYIRQQERSIGLDCKLSLEISSIP